MSTISFVALTLPAVLMSQAAVERLSCRQTTPPGATSGFHAVPDANLDDGCPALRKACERTTLLCRCLRLGCAESEAPEQQMGSGRIGLTIAGPIRRRVSFTGEAPGNACGFS